MWKKRDAWPGNAAFVPNVQSDHKTCVCAPAMSTGSHRDVLDRTAQMHPVRCNSNQKLSEHTQTHLLATSNLLQAEGSDEDTPRRKAKILRDGGCCFPPPSAHRLAVPH